MAEIRGCDLVVDYLVKEKVPYLFGYAGHGAVGLLDGVFNRSDELKIVFPRIESAAGYMADAYFRASGRLIPVYPLTKDVGQKTLRRLTRAALDASRGRIPDR